MAKEKKDTGTKEKFNFKEYMETLEINKYLKIGFLASLKEEPKTLAQTEKLLKKYSDGLICLTACIQGRIPQLLSIDDYNGAKQELSDYIDIFSKENIYLEVQNHGIEIQEKVISGIEKLSDEFGVKIVCTNDVHYIEKKDSFYQDILMCIQMQNKITDFNRIKLETSEFYLKSYDEMKELFKEKPKYLENTLEISRKCNVEIEFGKISFPKFFDDKTEEETILYFKKLCNKV